MSQRLPLTKERIVVSAARLADEHGIDALTIRSLAEHLDVKPMAIYHHVATKDEILDGIVDLVFGEIELPIPGRPWRAEVRRRAASARDVLSRHTWALALIESRTSPGPETLRHHDAMIGTLRLSGMSLTMTAHAYALLDAYVYGFVLQEATLPMDGPDDTAEVAAAMFEQLPADAYPHLTEFALGHVMQPGYDFGQEFDFGLDLILDGFERTQTSQATDRDRIDT